MTQRRITKLAVSGGLLLAGNGLLLAVSPPRFAVLRRIRWLPESYDAALDQLAVDPATGRAFSGVAAAIGIALVAAGLGRTAPAGP